MSNSNLSLCLVFVLSDTNLVFSLSHCTGCLRDMMGGMATTKESKRNSKNNVREKRGSRSQESEPKESLISDAAMRSVGAIFALLLALFLVLSELGSGGPVGSMSFDFLSWLFGVGYTLLPISAVLLAVSMVRSFEHRFGWVHAGSVALFLISSLGLVNIAFPGRGGVLGEIISRPILAAADTTATVFFLLAFLVIALIIAFDINLATLFAGLRELLRRPDEEPVLDTEKDGKIIGMRHDDLEESAAPRSAAKEEPEVVVATAKERPMSISDGTNNEGGGFSFASAASVDDYTPPPLSLLAKNKGKPEVGDVKANANIIKRTLQNFGILVEMDEVAIGPTVTRYSMKPAEGVRLSKIVALQSNLELALAASPVRIEAPIPGKSLVGIEVPNIARTTLGMGPLLSEDEFANSDKPLMIALGRSITGQSHFADLAKMPHMLVAGTTGSGKSVTLNNFIVSLLYRCGPSKLRFIMVDPKRVELTLYNSIPHLLTPVITDAKKAILALKWLAKEMDRRYNILEAEGVRDIASYHGNVVKPAVAKAMASKPAPDGNAPKMPEAMPYIVLIIDELADIMSTYPRELEGGIVRLAQMSRAVGIHLILSTQRPSVKVITGLIKANIPARAAHQVASQIDSRTILDMGGAENLMGAGDMLFLSGEMSKPRRLQASYISEDEVKRVVAHIVKTSEGTLPNEINFDEATNGSRASDPLFASLEESGDDQDDELYAEAKKTIIEAGKASTSYLQRKLGIGYARAAKLMDILEEKGVIGPADGAKPRDVIGAGNADELANSPLPEEEAA